MQAPEPPYPSFSHISSQFRLPAYRASHLRRYHPYPRSKSSRRLHLDDPPMRTIDSRYDGPRLDHLLPTIDEEDTDGAEVNLHNAMTAKDDNDTARVRRVRRLSLSTLVMDLALAVRRRRESLRVIRKENEVRFDMLT